MSRAAIVELLRAGVPAAASTRQVHVRVAWVHAVREQLGLPYRSLGPAPAECVETVFWLAFYSDGALYQVPVDDAEANPDCAEPHSGRDT